MTPGRSAGPRTVGAAASHRLHKGRILSILVVTTLVFAAFVGRLVDLQVASAARLQAYGARQRLISQELPAARGSVLDRSGAELVLSVPAATIIADPRMVTDPSGTVAALSPILGIEPAALLDRLSRPSNFEYLARQVDLDVGAAVAIAVALLDLDGIYVRLEPTRRNPSGELARGVLGSVDVDGIGVSGIEEQFNEVLLGSPGRAVYERSLNGGVPIPVGERQIQPSRPGDDLVLTLDSSLQYLVEEALADQITSMSALGGTAIVMVPGTGEILAMASMTLDPESGVVATSGYNQVVVDSFAPGSVIKLVTVAASIEEGLSSPDRTLTVADQILVANHWFTDHTPHAAEPWTVSRILVDSSNVGAIRLGLELGDERLHDYLTRFGFGATTGLGFPGESSGVLRSRDEWHGSDIGGVVIGTGVAVTAMQVLAAYNVIANGGVYVAPRLVSGSVDASGAFHELSVAEPRRVVSPETSAALADMLRQVVTEGTGQRASVAGYTVAGKTGTAWKRLPDGTFEDAAGNHQYMATFVGFAPVEDPRISVIVVLDRPRNAYSGGGAAAPAFSRIAEHALGLLDVPPSATGGDTGGTMQTASDTTTAPAVTERVRATAATVPEASTEASGP